MIHTATRSPLSATVAVIAAGAVVLGPTTLEPPRQLLAPTISTQAVHLTALAGPIRAAEVAAAGVVNGVARQATPTANAVGSGFIDPLAGAAAGFLFGFIIGGGVAISLLSWVPEPLNVLVTPVIQATAILGAIIGIPIGAVALPIISIVQSVSGNLSPAGAVPAAAARMPAVSPGATTKTAPRANQSVARPHRATRPDVRPQRNIAPSAASGSGEAPAAQQHAKPARQSVGHARNAASKGAARS